MRKKIIAGNWKMNKAADEARELAIRLFKVQVNAPGIHVVIIPPFVYLSEFSQMGRNAGVYLGAQDSFHERNGAYTGEISAYILHSLGVSYCLVGHSERRKYFHETDQQCLEKVQGLFNQDIVPILCVGEELEVRESGRHFDHVQAQLLHVINKLSPAEISRLVIAYEPVWAIGTGRTATVQQASEMHGFIRELIHQKMDAKIAAAVHILYGGSVNADNAWELMQAKDIDGVLVGGASLQAESFEKIIQGAH
jgi:triosephosphate isomerase